MGLDFILLFLVLAALIFAMALKWDSSDDRMRKLRERLELVEQAQRRESRASLALIRDDLLSEIPALQHWLSRMGRGVALRTWLRQAAIEMRPGKFLVLSAGLAGLGGLLAMPFTAWYGALLTAVFTSLMPYMWAKRRRAKRMAKFQAQFPEAIDLLVRASRAGHPPNAALELIATEMPEPMAGEFRQVFDQQRFGMPLRDCLLNLAERVPLVDVSFFATAMIIQRESGGNLGEILSNLSHLIRERVKILRQVKTHTSQGRMTLYVLIALAPLLLIAMFVINRQFALPLFTDPMGRMMLGLGVVLQVVGCFLLSKVVSIEV